MPGVHRLARLWARFDHSNGMAWRRTRRDDRPDPGAGQPLTDSAHGWAGLLRGPLHRPVQPLRLYRPQFVEPKDGVHRRLARGRVWLQRRLLFGGHEAERRQVFMLRLLLRCQRCLWSVLRRDRHHGGQRACIPLHAPHPVRPRGHWRRLWWRRLLERPPRLHQGAVRSGCQVHRHNEAIQGVGRVPDRLAEQLGVHEGHHLSDGQRLRCEHYRCGLQRQRAVDGVLEARRDASVQLLEVQQHVVDGRRGRRPPGSMPRRPRPRVQRKRPDVRLPDRRRFLGEGSAGEPESGARAGALVGALEPGAVADAAAGMDCGAHAAAVDPGADPAARPDDHDDDDHHDGALLDHEESGLLGVAVLPRPRDAVLSEGRLLGGLPARLHAGDRPPGSGGA
mmetsp:Transcript_102822/g.296065  ORF Transcript_102822/g.296065 Transcript_102822/m.296065 type:complete len:393 (-) Transcript_102822:1485-2663(-)